MILATFIIVAHTLVPHQHKTQLQNIIHECLFSGSESEEISFVDIFHKLEDVIKHINLGEKHLENFRISSYKYEIAPIFIFDVPEILNLKIGLLIKHEKSEQVYSYNTTYISTENKLSIGLRAPPCI